MSAAIRVEGVGDGIVVFVEAIRKAVRPRTIEIGYEPEADGNDPVRGDPAWWYCEVTLQDGATVRKRARGMGDTPVLEACAAAAEALGLTVRLRYEDR